VLELLGRLKTSEGARAAIGTQTPLAFNISSRSLLRTLHSDLHYHLYKIQIVQELSHHGFASRKAFYEQFLDLLNENPDLVNHPM
jgi:hypothetical protein